MRANWPSFFVCLGISFCISVAASHDYLGLWLGICCLLIAWVISPGEYKKYSLPALALISLLLLILTDLLILKPHEFPVAYFIVSYGLLGFIVFSQLKNNQIVSVFRIIVFIFCLLSIWSLVQYIFSFWKFDSHGISAGAIFANPNSYAATINLILLPLISIYLVKQNGKSSHLYFVILLLFTSLITTQSRGAWVAFIMGFLLMTVLLVISKSYFRLNSFKRLLSGFVLVFVLVSCSKFFVLSLPIINKNYENNYTDVIKDNFKSAVAFKGKGSLEHRKELALIAWKTIKENKYFGIGYYNTIYYHYKDVTGHVYTKTHYIHNDYLQIWLELGLLGIIILLSIVITTYWVGIKSLNNMRGEDRIWIIAILSGLTAIFTHALVSFIFYVPALICLISGYIAVLNNILIKNNEVFAINIGSFTVGKKIVDIKTWHKRLTISLVILIILFSFVLAQISYRAGKSMLNEGNIDQASTLFKLARGFSPGEVGNYIIEAAFWKNRAFEENNHEAAVRADELYEQLMLQNKYDADSRLHRAILHRDGFSLLSNPASKETIIGWLEQGLSWRPHHNILQSEYLRTLKRYGRVNEARVFLAKYLKMYPKSNSLANVREEIMN